MIIIFNKCKSKAGLAFSVYYFFILTNLQLKLLHLRNTILSLIYPKTTGTCFIHWVAHV